MQSRGLIAALVLGAALAGAVWWSLNDEKKKEKEPPKDASPKLVAINESQVKRIEIRRAGSAITVEQGDESKWKIVAPAAYPADYDAIAGMTGILQGLNSERVIDEKPADLSQFGLAQPQTEVLVTQKDGKTARLLIGDETPVGGGFYAKADGDPKVYAIPSYNKTPFDKSVNDLRDKRLLSFDTEKLTRVELTAKKQTLEFGRNAQNEWQIVKPVPLRADNGLVEEIVRRLKEAKMDLNLADDEKKKAASAFYGAELIASARVTDAAGTQSLEVRKAKDNAWYAKSSAVEGAHKIEASLGEGLDKGLDELRSKKLFDFGFSDPGQVELKWDTKSFTFTKSGEDWLAGGKKMDSFAVQSLIDKLRDLAAIKFPLTAPEGSTVEFTVTSNAGKRVEKVRIAKTADNFWYARRDGEPAIYEVDGKIIEDLQKAAGEMKEAKAAKK